MSNSSVLHQPSRANVDELIGRLARLQASAVTLGEASATMRPGDSGETLHGVLDTLERDVRLLTRDIARVRATLA
jgi:hypothetical protein